MADGESLHVAFCRYWCYHVCDGVVSPPRSCVVDQQAGHVLPSHRRPHTGKLTFPWTFSHHLLWNFQILVQSWMWKNSRRCPAPFLGPAKLSHTSYILLIELWWVTLSWLQPSYPVYDCCMLAGWLAGWLADRTRFICRYGLIWLVPCHIWACSCRWQLSLSQTCYLADVTFHFAHFVELTFAW